MSESGFIDLHSHTTESDGTLSPCELVEMAVRVGLSALAITDHDTFSGYQQALSRARALHLDLVMGIELNTRLHVAADGSSRAAHMLAYFPGGMPASRFLHWLEGEREERQDRNRRLAEALQAKGIDISLGEVEQRGRALAGRTHFAQLLVEKGYASHFDEAFTRFLGESAPTHIERQSQTSEEAIARIREGGGIPVIAHPIRLHLTPAQERERMQHLKAAGLLALEVYHSDHSPELQTRYRRLADELDLLPTGGSDFHGDAVKHDIALGTGRNGNVRVPHEVLDNLRMALVS